MCQGINKDRVYKTILLANKAMKYFKIPNPRIGLAALNTCRRKLFGTEEWDEIMPAVIKARRDIDVTDPSPADTLLQGDLWPL